MHSDSKMLCSVQQATRACRKQSSPTALAHGAAISRSFATSRTPFLLPLVTDAPKCPASPCSQLPGGSWDDSSSGMFSLAPAAEIHAAEQMQTQRCCSSEPRSGDGLWDDGMWLSLYTSCLERPNPAVFKATVMGWGWHWLPEKAWHGNTSWRLNAFELSWLML